MISLYSQEEIDEMYLLEVRRESEAKGEAKGKEDMVIEMIKKNVEPSLISAVSHFSLEKINEIKERLLNNVQLANE
ncbi:MAG: hypothetical protein LIO87_07850 [Eubacterium sp.]|nr:hypothetical protein [Eubacterium sp.]